MQQYDRKFERERERALRRKARVIARRERGKRIRDIDDKFKDAGSFLIIGSVTAAVAIMILVIISYLEKKLS